MNAWTRVILIVLLVIAAGGGGFWFGRHGANAEPDTEGAAATQPAGDDKPVADVRVAPVRMDTFSQTVTAYGSVVAQAGNVSVVSVPYEARVVKVLVAAGEQVAAKANVVQIEPSADEWAALEEARQSAATAERDFAQTQQRFNDHLATNVDLSQAQQAVALARLKLASITKRGVGAGAGAGAEQTLQAAAPGLVSKLDVQPGQTVPAGAPLVEIAADNQIEICLNVDPADVPALKPGQAVQLRAVSNASAPPLTGKIRTIVQRIDPATRLASVLVSMPPDAHWLLESFVQGDLVKTSARTLLVPRDAVLPAEGGEMELFTVREDHAVIHKVKVGLENDHEAQIISEDIKAGDSVVVVGNYALEDGMAVNVEGAKP